MTKRIKIQSKRLRYNTAVARYQKETNNKDSVNELSQFKRFSEVVGNPFIDQIDRKMINEFILKRQDDGVSNTTINRTLQKLRSLLNKAKREWEVIDGELPFIKMFTESGNTRVRWLTRNQVKRLAHRLPEHLADMMLFSVETGLRESNVTRLRWDQIHFSEKVIVVEGDDVLKSDNPFMVPLTEKALEILKRNRGNHPDRVFTFRGNPVKKASTKAFREAVDSCGIRDFRWHDLRHTWATWHVQRGTPLEILQKLGGWSSLQSVQRYAHYGYKDLRPYVEDF
ncbi:integrase [Thiosulfatimonas sediminis]|uniref:Integrase n=1 Tax=Thiosulfatimonas sediminis TaxID=2675054 RepID=A0A6F8PVY7_9GAMM|nr:site-specific integrase [Thiosulfatimonas sediminis]BBP46279.1 integrase [Thiosulfatimonas sediminis]